MPADTRVNVSRPDGRPEAYDIPIGTTAHCIMCSLNGHEAVLERGKVVLVSPIDAADGNVHFACVEQHVPDDIVIYDPVTKLCRDKRGENVWSEERKH